VGRSAVRAAGPLDSPPDNTAMIMVQIRILDTPTASPRRVRLPSDEANRWG
jgi:hypothetical protein